MQKLWNCYGSTTIGYLRKMEYILICSVAFLGSGLTLFSGFGLGTLLVPVFGLFFPIEIAIILTAIVHFLNNLFKVSLLGKYADKTTIIRFGIPSVFAALLGAYILTQLNSLSPIATYDFIGKTFSVLPLKLIIGLLLIFFALFDIIPSLANLQFDKKYLPLGGVLSGFFGGLSGNQGALRSAFLIRAHLSKEAYVATGVVIACLIDTTRLFVYSKQLSSIANQSNALLLFVATLSAFGGAYLGNKILKKATIKSVQTIVAVMLIGFGVLLSLGII